MKKTGILLLSLTFLLAFNGITHAIKSEPSMIVNVSEVGEVPSSSGSIIAFGTREGMIGYDLNGDGDTRDGVIRYYNAKTASVTNTGEIGWHPSVSGTIIAFTTSELSVSQDLNQDGDFSDQIIRFYDIITETTTNTGVEGSTPSLSGSTIAFLTWETWVTQDLNGDDDTSDYVIRYYDIVTNTVTNTGAVGDIFPSVSGSFIAFYTREAQIGQDLDGDNVLNDDVVRYYDISTGEVINTGIIGRTTSVSGSTIAFVTYETMIGQDLNGDGDYTDFVIRFYDLATGAVTNTGADGRNPSIGGSIIAFETYEWIDNQDFNNDGDTNDIVIRYYDIATEVVTNTGAGINPSVSNSLIVFETEEWRLGQDLNGDGDTQENVIRYYTLPLQIDGIPTVSEQIEAFLEDGSIDNEGISEAAQAILDQAQAMLDKGNINAAINMLNAFINLVEAQSGFHITPEAAQSLIETTQIVIDDL